MLLERRKLDVSDARNCAARARWAWTADGGGVLPTPPRAGSRSPGVGARCAVRRRGLVALLRRLALGARVPAAVPQLDPQAAYAAGAAGDLGAVELGARDVDSPAPRRLGDRQQTFAAGRPRALPRRPGPARAQPASRAAAPWPATRSPAADGWNRSGPNISAGAAVELGPEDRAERHGPAAGLDGPRSSGPRPAGATRCGRPACSGGGIGWTVPEVGAGADDHLDVGLPQPAYRLGQVAHRRRRAASGG